MREELLSAIRSVVRRTRDTTRGGGVRVKPKTARGSSGLAGKTLAEAEAEIGIRGTNGRRPRRAGYRTASKHPPIRPLSAEELERARKVLSKYRRHSPA